MPRRSSPEPKPTYHKSPGLNPAEYTVILKVISDTAWIKSEDYTDLKSAMKKLETYVASLP